MIWNLNLFVFEIEWNKRNQMRIGFYLRTGDCTCINDENGYFYERAVLSFTPVGNVKCINYCTILVNLLK